MALLGRAAAGVLLVMAGVAAGCAGRTAHPPAPARTSPATLGNSPETASRVPPLPPSWVAHPDAAHGFTVGTPGSWVAITRDSPTLEADLGAVAEHSADLRAYFHRALDSTPELRLVAADPRSISSGFAANLNVTSAPLSSAPRAPTLRELAAAKLARLTGDAAVSGARQSGARVGGREAARFDYHLAVGSLRVAVRSYLLVGGTARARSVIELTMGAPGDEAHGFDTIAATFSAS